MIHQPKKSCKQNKVWLKTEKNRPLKKRVFHEKQLLVVRATRKLPLLHKASHLTGKLAISNNIKRSNHKSLCNLTLLHHETLIFFVELLSHHYFWILQHYNRPSDGTF